MSLSNVECISPDFEFKINGKFYQDDGKYYVCSGKDVTIEVVDAISQNPINLAPTNATNIEFRGQVTDINHTDAIGTIMQSDFVNNKAEFKVEFMKMSTKVTLSFKVFIILTTHVEIDESTHQLALIGYDENKEPNYPYYDRGFPFKLITTNKSDKVKLKVKRIPSVYHTNLAENIEYSDLTPNHINYSILGLELQLEHNFVETENSFLVKACANIDLMNVDIKPDKKLTVEIYTLCESDDDKPNYCHDKNDNGISFENSADFDGSLMPDCVTPINSPTHNCIDVGPDLSLDRYLDRSFWEQKINDFTKPSDIFEFNIMHPNLTKISPSYITPISLSSALGYFCNSRPLPTNVAVCPEDLSTAEIQNIQNDLNSIYNQAGIKVVVVNKGKVYFNFDLRGDDDNAIDITEQNHCHHIFNPTSPPGTPIATLNTLIWRLNDIKDNDPSSHINGRATFFGVNTVTINVSNGTPNFRTIPHEIGHAKYKLNHPDGDGYIIDNLHGKVDTDKYNIMNSGPLYQLLPISSMSDFRLRRYQWTLIQENH